MNSETDPVRLAADLQFVAQNAQDPTIRRIAKAANESLDRGRSFFDDFVEGIDRLPL
jgi:hypothetical protein